ncbi:tetratricopeptide repeat protein, partial [Streptomyces sp. SID1328]|nr:tetratricopeptide repeat protein [Streptomyces sp. SID1328]
MALGRRRKRGDDGRPDTPEPALPPAADLVFTMLNEDGTEEEISRVGLPPHEFYGMRANSAHQRLGPEHPETLRAFRDYARVLTHMEGRQDEARERLMALVYTQSRTLGYVHEDTLTTAADLAGLMHVTGELGKSEEVWRSMWTSRAGLLGPDHPHTLDSASSLASVLEDLRREPEAAALRR